MSNVDLKEPKSRVTLEEMAAADIDLAYRDFCAHLLIPLNKCRRENFYLPWKCEHERHAYELCEYKEYKRRLAIAKAEKEKSEKA